MIDIKLIRDNTQLVREAIEKRHDDTTTLDKILELDETRRKALGELDELRRQRKLIAGERSEDAATRGRDLRVRIKELEDSSGAIEQQLNDLLLQIPNIPDARVPIGKDDSENPVVQSWGEPRTFPFEAKAHWDIGTALNIIDFDRGVKLSGTRFYVLSGLGARLQRALIAWMLDVKREQGYLEIIPPLMVTRETATSTGHLP